MATKLDDAKIRIILETPTARGARTVAPSQGGGDADGRGGDDPQGAPIPGTPTREERDRRREERRAPRRRGDVGSGVEEGDDGGAAGMATRATAAATRLAAAAGRRGLGTGVSSSAGYAAQVLGVGAEVGSFIAVEEALRQLSPVVTAMVEEVVKAQLEPVRAYVKTLTGQDVDFGIADAGMKVSAFLDRGVQAVPSFFEAGSRTYSIERARLLLGAQFRESGVLTTFSDEFDIAYQQNLATQKFSNFGGRLVGEAIGRELGLRVRRNLAR